MWTPRRVALLLGGMFLVFTAYITYARALGWLDGLPQIPHKYTIPNDGTFSVQKPAVSPTTQRLIDAFGPDCPELSDQNYPTKLEFRNGESSVVLAAGATPIVTGTNRMTLAPFSLASFGKPRYKPGEVVEITTFHADKAILEFDRTLDTPNDMNRAKLLRLELVSEPEQALPDPRRGVVHITNNQRSADPNKFMVMRTAGPIFYRDAKNNPNAATGPDIWTDAAVEIIDRSNLPRAFGAPAPATAHSRGADLREPSAVPAILAGHRLPPPTVTALGMKIFLEPEQKNPVPKKDKEKSVGVGGMQRIELRERVLINLWTDSRQGFVSTPTPPGAAKPPGDAKPTAENPFSVPEPPAATGGAVGGLFFATQSLRAMDRALLQIETQGPFTYDTEKNLGRFDVLPQANPNLPNDVQVSRILPRGSKQQLFTQVLEIEFNGSPTGPRPEPKQLAAKPEPEGSTFKLLHAWTYTPGRFLTISAEEDRLEAYGQDLLFEQAANRTTLTGGPLYAIRSNPPAPDGGKAGGNVLSAGAPNRPAKLVLEPGPAPDRKTVVRVEGPGKFELFDPASKSNTIQAAWKTSMSQTKEMVNGREQDRFTFTDGARFEDTQADYWLQARELKLWLQESLPAKGPADPKAAPSQPLPQRLLATGDVTSHSGDVDIEKAEFLTVMFRDGQPPPPPKVAPAPMGPVLPMPMAQPKDGLPPPMPLAPPAEQAKDKPKPPMKLKARVIDTWVVRYPMPKPADPKAAPKVEDKKADANKAAESTLKYELEKAWCEGQVIVHQDPEDPAQLRGTDILGDTLRIDSTPQGSVMTVTGNDRKPGEVHHDDLSILGPKVVIDQLHNLTTVEGGGSLSMRSSSDFTGTALKEPETLKVFWRDGMTFSGSNKTSEFVGKVRASQGESWVLCHTLQVHFDREVYFNQMNKPAKATVAAADPKLPAPKLPAAKDGKAKDGETAKVEKVYCYPAPDDEKDGPNTVTFNQIERDETGKIVKTQLLDAKELAVFAQAQDNGRGEFYQKVVALGPGTVRIWQIGQKDMVGPEAQPMPPMPGTPPKPPDTEMKLTVVAFTDQMTTKDKAKLYQEATFRGNIEVISAPADSPSATVARFKLPPRSVLLTCANQLVVSTHKREKGPTTQRMDATGNAFIRSDEYDGSGEQITFDGQFVTLEASGASLASIKSRYKATENSGKHIVYDRLKNSYKVDGSSGIYLEGGPAKK